jgi:hypothetical protein
MIEDNNAITLPSAENPILTSSKPSLEISLHALLMHIKSITDAVNCLTSLSSHTPQPHSFPTPLAPDVDEMTHMDSDDAPASCLLSTMSSKEITCLLHHPGTSFPSVQPCDTANASDTKTHWSAGELHQIMGCWKFRNYKHLLQVGCDDEWVNGGKFPSSLGSYATTPKAKQGGLLNRTKYHYLDTAHMDTAFGDCVLVGRYCYALILVDCAT